MSSLLQLFLLTFALALCVVQCQETTPDPCAGSDQQLRYDVQRLERKVEALEEDKVRLTLRLEQLTDKLDSLTQRVDGPLTEKIDGLTERLDVQTTETSSLTDLVERLKKSDNRQKKKIEELIADEERLTDAVERAASEIEQLNGSLSMCCESEPITKPRSCAEARESDSSDGVHTLNVNGHDMTVFCDQTTDGGGWAVIQRRENGETDFYRGWDDYLRGFGDPASELWLGLENIHHMTKTRNYKLRVDLTAFDGETAFAEYGQFYIDGADQQYRLHVSGFSGTAGDSLSFHDNQRFSTYDRDNDSSSSNCASTYHGAWWYNSCHYANLNGQYKQSAVANPDGVTWYKWKDAHLSLKKVEMKVKPVL